MVRKALINLMRLTILLIIVSAVCFGAVILWARDRSIKELGRNPVMRITAAVQLFLAKSKDRDVRCSSLSVWKLSYNFPANEEMREAVRVVRNVDEFSLATSPFGEFWMPARDVAAAWEMFRDEKEEIYRSGSNGVRPGDVVLDCGANIGVYSKYALRKGAQRVIAIEIAPEDIECLRRNLATELANGSATIYPKGVWDTEGVLELETSPSMSSMTNTVALGSDHKGPIVPVTTIDNIVKELKLTRVDFIKMDIEGAEANALRGASETLKRFKPRLAIALEHRPSDPDTLPALVKSRWPFYRTDYSGCAVVGKGHIQPNVMYGYAE